MFSADATNTILVLCLLFISVVSAALIIDGIAVSRQSRRRPNSLGGDPPQPGHWLPAEPSETGRGHAGQVRSGNVVAKDQDEILSRWGQAGWYLFLTVPNQTVTGQMDGTIFVVLQRKGE